MLPLETKQSGGKLLPHSDLLGGVFLEEVSRSRKRNRDLLLGTWNVRSLYGAGALMAAARELPNMIPKTQSGIEPATLRHVAQYLNKPRHRVPLSVR